MGWEWRVFYNLQREGTSVDARALTHLPELLGLSGFEPDHDPRTDAYYLLDFTDKSCLTSLDTIGFTDDGGMAMVPPPHPYTRGLKLRGGAKAGLEIKCLVEQKPNLQCEKWKKTQLEPDYELPEGGLEGVNAGEAAGHHELLRRQFGKGLSPFVPLERLAVRGLVKVGKERSQLHHKHGILLEHTRVRLQSDTQPGLVIVGESFGVDGKKEPLKEFIKSMKVREYAKEVGGHIMGYPELLHHLFVAQDITL